ncbi:hypothetical protein Sp245p_12610 [Azospirillum baldaniorum]|uniref:EF-hand domain-containing protein n=1 Tax=Azospirillum baldaniorum TaxID=1064539 RepID=A0A9P1NLA2_9PROT|nr:EF-hand domain-containing protein [Azospirillum baldaniorum]AWJ90567.1 hypothetical protein Sp245p_12610 [Azospirillum baldaniorum]NUB09800.1 EF-hand domain-containing protein [Azospirillum baldaniorum]TWA78778.1 EF hand domain-containing protein [Azospirillum brasilense]CCC97252.1 conserved exported protein of unknown function [Azospirillum baldaniorum]
MAVKVRMAFTLMVALAVPPHIAATAATASMEHARDARIFELLDDDEDGRVSMMEFKNNQMLVFYILDRNKDLALTADETFLPADVFASIAGADGKIDTLEFLDIVDVAFKQADTNHDGMLDRQEFAALLSRVRSQ